MTQTRRVRQIEFKKVTIARKNADAPSGLLGQLTFEVFVMPYEAQARTLVQADLLPQRMVLH
jgi:hypothetical protein